MTYREISARLRDAGIESADWDAALLIEHFCGDPLELIPLNPEKDHTSPPLLRAVERRASRYPLQYLIGEWHFFKQVYEVSPDCLIPRSDTEILVEEAIRRLPPNARFADLCTGSGCIAISVLAERTDTCAVALEKFEKTLALAERNAVKNGVRDRFSPILADVLTPDCLGGETRFDAILSNPPYIRSNVVSTLEPEPKAEPKAALDGGEDGLLFYRAILQNLSHLLRPDGFMLLEIGFDQAEDVLALGREVGFSCGKVIRDYGGNDRVVYLKRQD